MTKVAAIIAAGGRGIRMGAATPKQHLTLGGMTILQRSVAAFDGCEQIDEIVVVLPEPAADFPPVSAPRGTPLRTVVGGARRQDSVARGFDAVSPDVTLVVIHDAARPLCTADLIARTIDAAGRHGAAIASMPTHDTVKRLAADENGGRFADGTLARKTLVLAQTPQAFQREVLA
ncbi:MAG: 2-C-methyl-D-erythritol 4-phosphate cytidylyltransferase, partial [bacterium]